MNKSLSVALAAAALVFLGAGCTASALAPTPQAGPDAIEHPIPATRSATAPDEISTGELHVAWSVPVPIDPVTNKPFDYHRDGNKATIRGPELGEVPVNYEITMEGKK